MCDADPAAAPEPRSGRAERIGGIAILIALLALTLAYPSATRIHAWPSALLATIYWLAPVAGWIIAVSSGATVSWPNRFLPAGLVVLVAATAISAAASPFPAASLVRVWPTFAGAALFWLLHRGLSVSDGAIRARLLARAVSAVAAGIVVVSLVGWAGGQWPLPWGNRNEVPFGHSIYTAGFTVLGLPWIALAAWRSRGTSRAAWCIAFVLGFVGLASTSSRGGVLALAVAAACAALAVVLQTRWSQLRKTVLVLALAAIAVAAVLANPRLRRLALEHSWGDAAMESNRQRSAMLAAGWKLGWLRPWLGWGPGTVPLAYPRVRAELDGGVDDVLELHNTPLQLWATLGLPGALALLLLAAGTAHALGRRFRDGNAPAEALAAATSLGGYAIFSLTDHQFDIPIIGALAAADLAFLTATTGGARDLSMTSARRSALQMGLACGAALFAIPVFRDLQGRKAYATAVGAWEQGRRAEWLAGLERAAALAPADPFYLHQAAGTLLEARDSEQNSTRRREFTVGAIQRLEASLRTGVHQELAHFNLGWLDLELERPRDAAAHFAAAARLVPDKGGVYFGLGLALEAEGHRPAAIRAFALEWVNDPTAMSSPAWEIPLLAPLRPGVIAETLRLYAELGAEHPPAKIAEAWARWWLGQPADRATLAHGFSAEARSFAAALPAIDRGAAVPGDAKWLRLYRGWRRPDGAARFDSAAGKDTAYGAALDRRARRHADSFQAFLTAPTEDEPALLRTYRRQRTGYGVLALHPDGPLFSDAYIVQENRIAVDFGAPLLPPKGWIPGRLLLARLPDVPTPAKP